MTRFSFGLQPDYGIEEAVGLARAADALGFHGCYAADDPRARDPWVLLAAAARTTERVRLGPSATHVYLREPTFIAQTPPRWTSSPRAARRRSSASGTR